MSTSKIHVGQNQGPGGQCADCFVRPLTARVGIVVKLQRGRWGEGEMKYLGGSCSLFENRKLVFKSSSFLVFKLSVLRKVGKIIREMRPRRESEKGSELGVMTRQLRCLFVLLARLFVIDAASPGR